MDGAPSIHAITYATAVRDIEVLLGTAAIIASSHSQTAALDARRQTLILVSASFDARCGYEGYVLSGFSAERQNRVFRICRGELGRCNVRLVRGGAPQNLSDRTDWRCQAQLHEGEQAVVFLLQNFHDALPFVI